MEDLLIGFAVVGSVVFLGYIVGKANIFGQEAVGVLSKVAFFAFSPALLFTVLAESNVGDLFSNLLPVSILAAAFAFLFYLIFSWFLKT